MTADEVRYTDVVCIGAGFAGICVGAQLQRQLGVDSFHIYEREASVGGTWFKNQYPGVMCDVPSIVYSLSFAPRRNWSDLYAPYQEILAYLTDVSRKYDLERRTSLRTQVTAAAWDDERKRWRVTLRNVDSGAEFAHECKLLFTGVGQFGRPRTVEDLGAIGPERFAGPILLSTSWDHSVDLTGKRVVLIGNGCTSCGFLTPWCLVSAACLRTLSILRHGQPNPPSSRRQGREHRATFTKQTLDRTRRTPGAGRHRRVHGTICAVDRAYFP